MKFVAERPQAFVPAAPRQRLSRWLVAFCLALLPGSLIALASTAHAQDAAAENEAKAEMLWNIAKFIRWPDQSFTTTKGQMVFTIFGEDDLAAAFASTMSTKSVAGHNVFVRFVRRVQDVRGSQMVYIAASESSHMVEVLQTLEGSSTLTVANSEGFAAHGGMVNFASENHHTRFEINLGRADRAGLKISAKLLALARVVESVP